MATADIHGYSLVIRDIFFDAVSGMPYFATFKKRKTRQMQIQPQHLPILSVYYLGEQLGPDGDANAGEVRFIHNVRIGFSIVIQNNDTDETEKKLMEGWWAIMNRLWTDQWIMNRLNTQAYGHPTEISNPDNIRIESVTRGAIQPINWGSGLNNELPIGELQYDATVVFRSDWPPVITDKFLHVHMEVVPLATDGTLPPAEEVERVIAPFDIPQ